MLEAVNDFILRFCTGTTQNMLFRGWQNRMALPATNTYIIYALENTERHGTNVNTWSNKTTDPDVITRKVLREYVYTIDLFSDDEEKINQWAVTLEVVGRSEAATKFFKTFNCTNAYTDNVEYIPYTDPSNQYVERYRVRLHLMKWEAIDTVQDFANEVVISKIINVDEKR